MNDSTKSYIAYACASGLFLVLTAVLAFFYFTPFMFERLKGVRIADLCVMAFATARLTRLLVQDKVFNWLRAWALDMQDGHPHKPAWGIRRTFAELIECSWCVGIWMALVAVVLFVSPPVGSFILVLLAVAHLGTLLFQLGLKVSSR
jgi:Flp pilus assembly protein TadB